MKTRSSLAYYLNLGLSGILACLALPVQAHHSFAMYDRNITHEFTGKLIRFIPGANHAQLIFELVDENGATQLDEAGKPVAWGVETGPSSAIARQGVTVEHFAEGTILTLTLNPLRDGRTFGILAGSVIHCGNAMPAGGCNEDTGTAHMRPDQ